jgi:hypothetical protein
MLIQRAIPPPTPQHHVPSPTKPPQPPNPLPPLRRTKRATRASPAAPPPQRPARAARAASPPRPLCRRRPARGSLTRACCPPSSRACGARSPTWTPPRWAFDRVRPRLTEFDCAILPVDRVFRRPSAVDAKRTFPLQRNACAAHSRAHHSATPQLTSLPALPAPPPNKIPQRSSPWSRPTARRCSASSTPRPSPSRCRR